MSVSVSDCLYLYLFLNQSLSEIIVDEQFDLFIIFEPTCEMSLIIHFSGNPRASSQLFPTKPFGNSVSIVPEKSQSDLKGHKDAHIEEEERFSF
jgi:hypothetical protein